MSGYGFGLGNQWWPLFLARGRLRTGWVRQWRTRKP